MVTVYTPVRNGTLTNADTAKSSRVTCIVSELDIVGIESLASISERGTPINKYMNATGNKQIHMCQNIQMCVIAQPTIPECYSQ